MIAGEAICGRPRCTAPHLTVPVPASICGPFYVYGSLPGTASELLRILDARYASRPPTSDYLPRCCLGSGKGAHTVLTYR